jgi:hypothetical protein
MCATMIAETEIPPLYFQGAPYDMSPQAIGVLRDSSADAQNMPLLRERLADEGYLYLPRYLDIDQVMAARMAVLEKLAERDAFVPGAPLADAVLKDPSKHLGYRGDVARNNPRLHKLLYDGRVMAFWDAFFGRPATHFDYTWFRVKTGSPDKATQPHADNVYMGRGTDEIFTTWVPIGDIPYKMGGLMLLEGSHKQEKIIEYTKRDVDDYCTNYDDAADIEAGKQCWQEDGGYGSRNSLSIQEELGGRWLTAEYHMGDMLIFTMRILHTSSDNQTEHVRLSSDSRYFPAGEPADERWMGEEPIAHGVAAKRGRVC